MPAASLNEPLRLNTARLRQLKEYGNVSLRRRGSGIWRGDGIREVIATARRSRREFLQPRHDDETDFTTEEAKETEDEEVDVFFATKRDTRT